MNKELSDALLDFYQKMLAPEFQSIQKKQAAHDGKFIDILGHFDELYKRLVKLEEEYQMITLVSAKLFLAVLARNNFVKLTYPVYRGWG